MAEPIGGLLGLLLFAAAQTWMVVRWGSCYARSSTDDVARALLLAIMLVAAVKCVTTFLPEAATMALMLALPFLSMGMLAVRLRDEADERPAEQWFTRASIPSFGRIVAAMAVFFSICRPTVGRITSMGMVSANVMMSLTFSTDLSWR